jgi:hypothetical protein
MTDLYYTMQQGEVYLKPLEKTYNNLYRRRLERRTLCNINSNTQNQNEGFKIIIKSSLPSPSK